MHIGQAEVAVLEGISEAFVVGKQNGVAVKNCSSRVVAKWNLVGVSKTLTRGLRVAMLIRSTKWGDQLSGTGVLWPRKAACG